MAIAVELPATGIAIALPSMTIVSGLAASTSGMSREGRGRWPVAELVACACGRAYEAEGPDARCPGCGRARPGTTASGPRRRGGFWWKLALGVLGSLVLVGLALPGVRSARESVRRGQCKDNLSQIGLALQTTMTPSAASRRRPSWTSRGGRC